MRFLCDFSHIYIYISARRCDLPRMREMRFLSHAISLSPSQQLTLRNHLKSLNFQVSFAKEPYKNRGSFAKETYVLKEHTQVERVAQIIVDYMINFN